MRLVADHALHTGSVAQNQNREVSPLTHDPPGVCTGDDGRHEVYQPGSNIKSRMKNKLHF